MSSELTHQQWELIEPLLPSQKRRPGQPGRPPVDNKTVLMGVLWILRTGAPWKDLPRKYGAYQASHRRYQQWVEQGVMDQVKANWI